MPDPFVRQIKLILSNFGYWLNSTKSLRKAMFFKYHTHFFCTQAEKQLEFLDI
jgi:hypothetical protein